MRAGIAFVVAVVLATGACSQVGPYFCDVPAQCVVEDDDGSLLQGVCTAYFLCAFADATCPGPEMLRYDESAGDLANVCVGDE